jgi:hypothetical protein
MKKRFRKKAHELSEKSREVITSKLNIEEAPITDEKLPRITNDTVAEHREEVLSSARKYIYPLQHSRHRIVSISLTIFVLALVVFFSYTLLALYKFKSTSTFVYRVTQVLPFPVAKAGPSFVSYENYLFEVRRYVHYYQTQQDVDFNSKSGQEQLADFRKKALDGVVNDAYIKQLAKEHHVSVSRNEVNEQISLLRGQNRLGGSDQVFEDVLKEFWGWSVDDFRRELTKQLLAQKVASALDTQTHQDAANALTQLKSGVDFATLAKQVSEDEATKPSGGEFGGPVEKTNRDIQPRVIDALFKLQTGQISDIVETPSGLEILKVYENNGGKLRAAHIFFRFNAVGTYVDPLKKEHKAHQFISV